MNVENVAPAVKPPRIHPLSVTVVNKIAAGEVIQRPCSAVKELIENSLDAGSTMIQINLRAGGLKLIQVQDDGHGIQPTDLAILCERFTTSKLEKFEDLSRIVTFGFRGEALASLSYVSRLSVTTRPPGRACAYKAEYNEGKLTAKPRACAGNPGTSIQAEDLFYNNPLRREAFKSPREEFMRVAEVVVRYSLHYAGRCGFFLRSLDRQGSLGSKSTPTSGDLRIAKGWNKTEVVQAAFGQRAAVDLLAINHDQNFDAVSVRTAIDRLGLKFEGLLSNPSKITSEGTPSLQLVLFVNNRLVECIAVKRAVEVAYAILLPHRAARLYTNSQTMASPSTSSTAGLFAYLSLEMPTTSLDVNVHPTKAEVHFLHEDEIVAGVRDAVEQILLRASGSGNALVRSLNISQLDDSQQLLNSSSPATSQPKQARLVSVSTSSPASSSTSTYRPERLVRTDVRIQRLDAFLNRSQEISREIRSPSPDVDSENGDADVSGDKDCHASEKSASHRLSPAERQTGQKEEKEPLRSRRLCPETDYLESSCSVQSYNRISLSNGSPCDGKRTGTGRRPVLLESVLTMREAIEARASEDARSLLRECVLVGCVSRSYCLVQQSTNLLLMRLHPLVKELFYQLLVVNFANHGEMTLSTPAPVKTLLILGLKRSLPEALPNDLEVIADKGCSILLKRATMLWDYFSIKIQSDENGVLHLHTLPMLLDRFTPNLNHLPIYLARLVRQVNWNEEGACFESLCRTTASFYSKLIKDTVDVKLSLGDRCGSTLTNSPDSSADESERDKENVTQEGYPVDWRWTVEHVLLPSIRTFLLPSHTMCFPTKEDKAPSVLKLTSLPDLYKVFERC